LSWHLRAGHLNPLLVGLPLSRRTCYGERCAKTMEEELESFHDTDKAGAFDGPEKTKGPTRRSDGP
jgi:hypothetical protein